jgi:hypothetical protein
VALKDKLIELSIPHVELEINSHKEIWDQVVQQTGHNVLPTIFVRKEGTDDGPVFVPNIDFKDLDEIIEKLKIYL